MASRINPVRSLLLVLAALVSLAAACGSDASTVNSDAGVAVSDDESGDAVDSPDEDSPTSVPEPEIVDPEPNEPSSTTDDGSTPPTTEAPAPTIATNDFPEVTADLIAARERWKASGITDYVMTWSPSCFCPHSTFTDTINAGVLVNHQSDGETFYETTGLTMEEIFSQIERALANSPAHVDAEFDLETGAVVSYWVDEDEMMADEEFGIIVESLDPVTTSQPGGPASLPDVELVEDWGCGFGFNKGSADQTLGLQMFFIGEWTESGPDLSSPVDISGEDWQAIVYVGKDLFADWCDDVVEEGELLPTIDAEYRVVAGTIVGDVDGSTATATLTGAVVNVGGEEIALPDLELRNADWGFFAG